MHLQPIPPTTRSLFIPPGVFLPSNPHTNAPTRATTLQPPFTSTTSYQVPTAWTNHLPLTAGNWSLCPLPHATALPTPESNLKFWKGCLLRRSMLLSVREHTLLGKWVWLRNRSRCGFRTSAQKSRKLALNNSASVRIWKNKSFKRFRSRTDV